MPGESALVTPSPSLNIEKKQKEDILSVIETSVSFQKAIEELEKKKI